MAKNETPDKKDEQASAEEQATPVETTPADEPALAGRSPYTPNTIQVLYGYRGKPSQEQYIPAGMYHVSDPQLHGLAEYLVTNGHAIWAGQARG